MIGSLFEAEALGALDRALGFANATDAALAEAGHVLDTAGLSDLARQADKVRELHRLFAVRLRTIRRRLAEGGAQ